MDLNLAKLCFHFCFDFMWNAHEMKCGGETSSRPFSEKSQVSISPDQYSKSFTQLLFIVCQVEDYCNILKLSSRPLAHLIKVFWKIKRGLELVSVHHFLHGFWRKIFLLLCSVAWPNFIVWLPLFREMLGNTLFPLISATGAY